MHETEGTGESDGAEDSESESTSPARLSTGLIGGVSKPDNKIRLLFSLNISKSTNWLVFPPFKFVELDPEICPPLGDIGPLLKPARLSTNGWWLRLGNNEKESSKKVPADDVGDPWRDAGGDGESAVEPR